MSENDGRNEEDFHQSSVDRAIPTRRWIVVAAGAALVSHLVFVARRPDLIRGAGDALIGLIRGAALDAGALLLLTALAVAVTPWAPRAAVFLLSAGLGAFLACSSIDTEYFAYARSHIDTAFVAYVREASVLRGSVGNELQAGWWAIHLLVCAAATTAIWWGPAPSAVRRPLLWKQVGLLAGAGAMCLAAPPLLPRQASTWMGAMAARSPVAEGWMAWRRVETPASHVWASVDLDDLVRTRATLDPFGSKEYAPLPSTASVSGKVWTAPLAHRGGRAPEGAWGRRLRRPNIVFLMLEGMETSGMSRLGASPGWTPELDRLAGEGTFFSSFFANGAHTPRALEASLCGLVPRLSGAPLSRAQPTMPVACLPRMLRDLGYDTEFLHGGLESFENRFEFLGRIGFGGTFFLEQFPAGEPRLNGGWGTTDARTYDQALHWLDAHDSGRPFFLAVLSISNHHPFHVPDPSLETEHDATLRPRDTMRYADREAGRFVEQLRTRGLLDNSVIFIFGDHGLTRDNAAADGDAALHGRLLRRAHVPLIVLAPDDLFPRRTIPRIASQVDLLPTVLDLLDQDLPHHSVGHSLGWTWAKDRDLPAVLHDLYSDVALLLRPEHSTAISLEPSAGVTAAQWSLSADGQVRTRIETVHPEWADDLRAVTRTVQKLYANEQWWSSEAPQALGSPAGSP